MGKIIEFPCNDYYEEWNYEDYYSEEFENKEQGYGEEVLVKENFIRGLVRKCLMFVLVRL